MKDGLIIIDKPAGWTSHDAVARLRKILKTTKIGHTGTLDPFATGVLVMLVGKATRLARFLHSDEKEYEAVLRFGFETDTGDATGERRMFDELQFVGSDKLKHVGQMSESDISAVLPEFRGEIEQVPPMYSAKKIGGKRLYKMAREGKEVEREPVTVTISRIECTGEISSGEGTKDFGLNVVCSAGTYVRTLAEDIGRKLDIGCHLAELRRTRAGRFSLDQAHTLEELAEFDPSAVKLIPMSKAVVHLPSITLTEAELQMVHHGRRFEGSERDVFGEGEFALLTADGRLAAIGEEDAETGEISPKLVMI
ncbi:MAG TPA: tRNA pseudouridine(55) synthase TruB [Aridibacter sp.]|nr:tRNA pseudouridine(55) synthase TruB [Aridibacter sp.]